MPMQDLTIEKHMANNVDTIDGNMNIFDAASKFINSKRRRFPVVENGKLIGQISQKDVLKAALKVKILFNAGILLNRQYIVPLMTMYQ